MHRIKFKVRIAWTSIAIAQYITSVLYPHDNGYWLKSPDDPNHWQLGSANDWFMTFYPETHEVELSYRYSGGNNKDADEAMDALAKWLSWRMNK